MIKFMIAGALIFLALAGWWTYEIQVVRNGPHWVRGWPWPHMGIEIGRGRDAYLMIDLPNGNCANKILHTSPHMETFYSDAAAAKDFLEKSGVCGSMR